MLRTRLNFLRNIVWHIKCSRKSTKPLQHAKHEIHPIHLQIIYLFYIIAGNRNDHFNSEQKSNKLQESNNRKKLNKKVEEKYGKRSIYAWKSLGHNKLI